MEGSPFARGPINVRTGADARTKANKQDTDETAVADPDEAKPEQPFQELIITVASACVFGVGIGAAFGVDKSSEFFAGYILEQSLSIDNLFVFILIFNYFNTTAEAQKRALKYGLAGSAIMRLFAVLAGAAAVDKFKPVLLIFAGILIYSSYKLLFNEEEDDDDEDLAESPVLKLVTKFLKVSDEYDGTKFFTQVNGALMATPLLLVVGVIELSDVVFAVDSIPAVFGITTDPLIVYSSNMFAILSLRSMFSFVSVFLADLEYLETALGGVLGFIGGKIIADVLGYEIPTPASLLIVVSMLASGIVASVRKRDKDEARAGSVKIKAMKAIDELKK